MSNKIIDMDGNELKVGDLVLVPTRATRIRRARITNISHFITVEMLVSKRITRVYPEAVIKYIEENNREYIK